MELDTKPETSDHVWDKHIEEKTKLYISLISFWNFLAIMPCFLVIFGWQCHPSIFLEIYRQKLKQSVSNGELSDEDVKSLERTQIMLCIPKQTVESAHADICGSLFEKVTISLLSTLNAIIYLRDLWNIEYTITTWDFKY